MKGKKRKGADEPKQPKPKKPPKGEPGNLGWVGPVSPQGRALRARLEERAKSRTQSVKWKGFIWGYNKVKKKIVAHFRLEVGIHHKQRKLASLAVLVQLAKCMLEEAAAVESQKQWGTRKQLVVFFGNASIGTR
ncbi:hypothetical protein HaLaN_12686, partial [Haematococcus lacustris]